MPVPGDQLRSRGWDVATGFSAPRGEVWPAGRGFGHTGFTGTSIWIDPETRTVLILLTARTQLKKTVTELRKKAANTIASFDAGTLAGIDVLRRDQFASLKGKRVGLVTNHTGRANDGTPTIDLLAQAEGVKLVALFSPEHGIRGELDAKVGDGTDVKTGLPVYSLYGVRTKPSPEQLKTIDILVYDIQDIGCRFYTYSSTLGICLEAAGVVGIPVLVLDRPNPIGADIVEGPVRDAGPGSFVAYHDIPLRHGMTFGELAKLFNSERNLKADLTVVSCANYRRGTAYDETNLPWVDPSPNMRHLTAALVYPGVGILETTNISVGRGTERPFEWLGAPWINGRELARDLNARNLPGVRFVPVSRTPNASVHKDQSCGGVDVLVKDWSAVKPVELGLHIAAALRKLYPDDWQTKNLNRLLVHQPTLDGILAGKAVAELVAGWQPQLQAFEARRAKVLIYAK